LALDEGEGSASCPCHFTPIDRALVSIERRVGKPPMQGLDTVKKRKISCPYLESNPGQKAHSLIALPTKLKFRRTYITFKKLV
jgi:hypothetical protein